MLRTELLQVFLWRSPLAPVGCFLHPLLLSGAPESPDRFVIGQRAESDNDESGGMPLSVGGRGHR